MYLAHIFLPAMLIVICRSQQPPSHYASAYGSDESLNFFGNQPTLSETLATSTTMGNDDLLDRYRELIVKSLLKLSDSCKVHDFLQNLKRNMENDLEEEDPIDKSAERNHQQRYINTLLRMLEKQRDNDATIHFPFDRIDYSKSALYYYVSISLLLQDKELDDTLSLMLHEKCCKNDANFYDSSICSQNDNAMADKRNTIKKVKFHSWGGKRSGGTANNNAKIPTNLDLSKDLGQSKIVIRTPFRPWGGKRQALDAN